MKLKELKHNHSLTDLLKVLIFSILMITPLLSVATRCLYVICNKNAYQSAEITQTTYNKVETQVDTNMVNTYSDLIEGNCYSLDFYNENIIDGFIEFKATSTSLIECIVFDNSYTDDYGIVEETEFNINYVTYIQVHNDTLIFTSYINYDEGVFYAYAFEGRFYLSGDFYVQSISGFDYDENASVVFKPSTLSEISYEEIQATTLDNVFEYSVNKLAESPILSWTQQTAIYTGVSTMTAQLGVSSQTIPMLIVYWFLLTVIYIIIDIIIKLFTWLTHMIGSKSV